jgi:hypothetical protein
MFTRQAWNGVDAKMWTGSRRVDGREVEGGRASRRASMQESGVGREEQQVEKVRGRIGGKAERSESGSKECVLIARTAGGSYRTVGSGGGGWRRWKQDCRA